MSAFNSYLLSLRCGACGEAMHGYTSTKYKGEKMVAVYLKQEFGGFAVHLLQK